MFFKYLICLSAVSFLRIPNIYSQTNFVNGSIVTVQGDTIQGYINNREWDVSPISIEFKKNADERVQVYTIADIASFDVNSTRYLTAEVDIETSPYLIEKMDTIASFSITKAKVFLKELVAGNKSLYRYSEKNDHPFFYVQANGRFELLKHKRYFQYQLATTHGYSATKVIMENKAYLSQIVRYLNDCMDVNRNLQYTRYDQNSLLKLFEIYYKCHPSENVVVRVKNTNFKFEMGPLLYFSNPSLTFSGANFSRNYPVRSIFSTSSVTSIGFSADLVFMNAKRKFTIGNELIYNYLKSTGTYTVFVTNDDYDKYTTQADISMLRLNSIFRVSKNVGKVEISALAGFLMNFSLSEKIEKIDEIKRPSSTVPTITTNKVELFNSSLNTGIISGLGVGYKQIRLDARYELGLAMNGPSDLRDLGTTGKINSIAFVLAYKW